MRKTGRFLTAAAALMGSTLLTAAPAEAAPYWQTVSTNLSWKCAPTAAHPAKAGVGYQACLVRNAYDDAQVVLVVVNNSSSAVTISGTVTSSFGPDASCSAYNLAVGERRGCFGTTGPIAECLYGAGFPDPGEQNYGGTVRLTVNGVGKSMDSPTTECVEPPA
ncbi:hypothetical protein [Streptomyces sp. NPDC006368]|uniref:hypothetical protein n=1 Tax=Streptomyces sp. NPDC006368 TaxID=3156760 RepID=UPI0033AC261F